MYGTIPNNLKKYREAAGLSRDTVAQLLGVTSKTLYRYECGLQSPNVYTAIRLAGCYHCDIGSLFPVPDTDPAHKTQMKDSSCPEQP